MRNAFLKYALKDQNAVRRVQVEQVGSSRVTCGQEEPKAAKWGLVGLGRIKSGIVRLTKWLGEWLI